MRFFGQYWGFIFEFNSIKDFLMFTLGRICGFFVFFGMADIFFTIVHYSGCGGRPFPLLYILSIIFKMVFLE